jgi:ABC-2 type transport system permease protein
VFTAVSLALVSVTLGLLISGLASNAFQVIQLMLLFVVPQILLSGIFSLSSPPRWLQILSLGLPLTYGVDALRAVMLRGASLGDIRFNLLVLWSFIALFFLLAAVKFRKKRAQVRPRSR